MHDTKIKTSTDIERHTLTVLVDNEAGVLARVVGLFSGRGYNIESLTVAEVDPMARTSRITIVTSGTLQVIEQIETQLRRLVPTHRVTNWTDARNGAKAGIEREMALIKVAVPARSGSRRCAWPMPSAPVPSTPPNPVFVFEITGSPAKIDSFVDLMRPLGLVDVSRTGVAAISRGPEAM